MNSYRIPSFSLSLGSVEIVRQSPDIFTLETGPTLSGQNKTNSSEHVDSGTAPVHVRLECYAQGTVLTMCGYTRHCEYCIPLIFIDSFMNMIDTFMQMTQ